MLLLMLERRMPIDMVLTADTGMEFPEMYEHLAKLDEHLYRERGIHLTTLRHPKGFEYLMFEEKKQKPSSIENREKLGVSLYGNGWPGVKVRWCTGQLKTHLINKEVNRLKGAYQALHYVGIAADEPKRIKKDWTVERLEQRFAAEDAQISVFLCEEKEAEMKKKQIVHEDESVETMLRGTPSSNILVSFDGKPARSLEELQKERKRKKKERGEER